MVLALAAVASAVGGVVALGSLPLTLIVAGALGGALLLFVPTPWLVQGQLALALMGAGCLMYYGKVAQAHWLPYALAAWLWLKLPLDGLLRAGTPLPRTPASPFAWAFGAWLAVAAVASLANLTPPLSVLVGARSHVFIWSLAFAMAAGALDEGGLRRACLGLLAVAALQLPFAAQQHFMNIGSIGSWDTVVGTFGGDPEGGGASGAMVIYQAIALGLVVGLAKRGQLRPLAAGAIGLAILGSVALAEVKAFFLLAPLMLLGVLAGELRARPVQALAGLLGTAVVLGGLFAYYKQAYYDDVQRKARETSLADYVDYVTSADGKLDLVNRYTGEVSRLGAPLLWAQESARDGGVQQLTGYGLRASRTGGLLGAGEAARRFPFNLTTSAVTVLLWETGVLGLCVFMGLLACVAFMAHALARNARVPPFHRAVIETLPATVAVLAASSFYNDAVVNHYTIQVLLAFLVGHLLFWRRAVRSTDGTASPRLLRPIRPIRHRGPGGPPHPTYAMPTTRSAA